MIIKGVKLTNVKFISPFFSAPGSGLRQQSVSLLLPARTVHGSPGPAVARMVGFFALLCKKRIARYILLHFALTLMTDKVFLFSGFWPVLQPNCHQKIRSLWRNRTAAMPV